MSYAHDPLDRSDSRPLRGYTHVCVGAGAADVHTTMCMTLSARAHTYTRVRVTLPHFIKLSARSESELRCLKKCLLTLYHRVHTRTHACTSISPSHRMKCTFRVRDERFETMADIIEARSSCTTSACQASHGASPVRNSERPFCQISISERLSNS